MYKINILYVVYFLSSYHVFHHWPWCFSLSYCIMNLDFYIFQNISLLILELSHKHHFLLTTIFCIIIYPDLIFSDHTLPLTVVLSCSLLNTLIWSVKIGLRLGIKCHYVGNDSIKSSSVQPIVFNFITKLNAAVEKVFIFCRWRHPRRPILHHRKKVWK